MYTPRQSSVIRAHTSLDPATGIRVVIQPEQSSYFAGEPFTCTLTFTNTRAAAPSQPARSLSATFNPGHKRAAHSVSSAPLARPPTSPGTPKTAQPFLSHQSRTDDTEEKVRRRGLVGKPATPTAVLEKKRKNLTRSLSVDISPQDIIKRLSDPGSSTPPTVVRSQSERVSPTSPLVSSPLARDHVNNLPPSHPHARKPSMTDDIISNPHSQSISLAPTTPSTASFQTSLDPITESGSNSTTPTTSEYPNHPDKNLPPLPSQPQSSRTGLGHRPSNLGLGVPLSAPSAIASSARTRSVGANPPHSAFSTTFTPPSTELLLYAYAQLAGTLSIEPSSLQDSSELLSLRESLRKRTAMGGGTLDIESGFHRSRITGGFFGFRSSSSISNSTPNSPGLLGSFLGGSPPPTDGDVDGADETLPTLETQRTMVAVDLALAPGESKSFLYTLDLPDNLPPTFKGRTWRFSYQLVVGTCRASTPFISSVLPPKPVSPSPGLAGNFGDSERRRSRVMRVPIRVYNHVAVGRAPHPYDLLWPVARRCEQATVGRVEEVKNDKGSVKLTKPTGSLQSVRAYARRLTAGTIELDMDSSTGDASEGGSLSGCREAVEITTRNPKKISYDVNMAGEKVAVLTFIKSAYRLGETVLGVVEFNEEHSRAKVLKLSATLEAQENLPWTGEAVRRVHAEHHSSLVLDMQRVTFALDIPSDASPAFEIAQGSTGQGGGLEWKVRLCLLVSAATGPGDAKGKSRAVEVRSLVRDGPAGEWGSSYRASDSLAPMERVRATPPEPQPRKSSSTWTAIFSPFAAGTYHDADERDEDEDDEDWIEMGSEMVECMVPLRVFAGNTAFRPIEVVFEV